MESQMKQIVAEKKQMTKLLAETEQQYLDGLLSDNVFELIIRNMEEILDMLDTLMEMLQMKMTLLVRRSREA